jgi:hypothetical protein
MFLHGTVWNLLSSDDAVVPSAVKITQTKGNMRIYIGTDDSRDVPKGPNWHSLKQDGTMRLAQLEGYGSSARSEKAHIKRK